MKSELNKNLFFIKEHVGMFKAANNFDIYDPSNQQIILTCREENLSFFTRIFRFSDLKRMTPFEIDIKTRAGERVIKVKRGISVFLSKVEVFDGNNKLVGTFNQKLFSIGGEFDVLDENGKLVCTLRGKWTSWDFKFVKDNIEFAHVTKKWAGIGKELFTTADNYILQIDEKVRADNPIRILIMAAVMCIDMVLKE